MLKTDFKADVFEGNRKYRITTGTNEVSEIVEVTEFVQEGDIFTPEHINATNKAINRIDHVTEVTLTAAGWTGSAAPYAQTITVSGATADMEAMVVSALADGATEAVQKVYSKAFGIVTSGTASLGNGSATFKVYKRPVTDIKIGLKGVL